MWADVVKKKICLWPGKGTFLVLEGGTALSTVDSGFERMTGLWLMGKAGSHWG